MKHVLTYSLGHLPWSLANPDGSLAKRQKSKLLHLLETDKDLVCDTDKDLVCDVPANSAWLIDGMALLQCMTSLPATFGEKIFKILAAHTSSRRLRH